MKVNTLKTKGIALIMALLVTLAFMPSLASAAEQSTSLEWQNGKPEILKPVLGSTAKDEVGLIQVKANGGDEGKVICQSKDKSIAVVEYSKKNQKGYYNYNVLGKGKGKTEIIVTAADNEAVSESIPVTVEADGIYIEFKSGGPITTAIGAKPSLISAVARDGIDPDGPVECVSSDETIVKVEPQMKDGEQSKQSKVYWKFDVTGLKEGTATITVRSKENPDVQKTVEVKVVDKLITVISKADSIEKGFTESEFNALKAETIAAWSGRNHSFTYKEYGEAKGPSLETVLEKAGIKVNELADDQLIQFTPSDGVAYQGTFTVKEILRDKRYYYPNSKSLTEGAKGTDAEKADAVTIPTILCNMDNSDARLVFGQIAPNERSNSVSIKNMTTGGTIEVLNEKATAIKNDVTASKPDGSTIKPGTEIVLSSDSILTTEIYYTVDGTKPSKTASDLYNYRTKEMSNDPDGGLKNATIKAPDKEGTFVIKVIQTAYGKLDSEVKTFTYTVSNKEEQDEEETPAISVGTPKIKTVASAKKKQIKVTVKKAAKNATIYKYSYRKAGAKKWTTKWSKKKTYTLKKLKNKGLYQIKVTGYDKKDGVKGADSKVAYRYLSAVLKKAKGGKSKVTVTWKKDKKASGYEIRYATSKKALAKAKITKVGKSKTKKVIKGLKKGKKYYVQVRPYKNYKGHKYNGIWWTKVAKVK